MPRRLTSSTGVHRRSQPGSVPLRRRLRARLNSRFGSRKCRGMQPKTLVFTARAVGATLGRFAVCALDKYTSVYTMTGACGILKISAPCLMTEGMSLVRRGGRKIHGKGYLFARSHGIMTNVGRICETMELILKMRGWS